MKEKLMHKLITITSHISSYFSNATSDLHSDVLRPCKLRGRRPCLQTGRAQKHWYLRGFVAVDPQPRQGLRPRLKTGGAENTGIYGVL